MNNTLIFRFKNKNILSYIYFLLYTTSFLLIALLTFNCGNEHKSNSKIIQSEINLIKNDDSISYILTIKNIKSKNIKSADENYTLDELFLLCYSHIRIAIDIISEYSNLNNNENYIYNYNEALCYLQKMKNYAENNNNNNNFNKYLFYNAILKMNISLINSDEYLYNESIKIFERFKDENHNYLLYNYYLWRGLDYGNIKSEYLKKAISDPNTKLIINYDIGNVYYLNNLFIKAIENYKIALSINPNHLNSICAISLAYIKLSDFEKANTLLKHGIEINDKHSGINHTIGYLFYVQKKYGQAIEYFNKVIEQNEYKIDTLVLLSDCYLKLKDFQNALYNIDKAIKLTSNYSNLKELNKIKNKITRLSQIKYDNNTGSDIKNTIKIAVNSNIELTINAVNDYLSEKFGIEGVDWYFTNRQTINDNNKYIEKVSVYIKKDKRNTTFYFEFENFFDGGK